MFNQDAVQRLVNASRVLVKQARSSRLETPVAYAFGADPFSLPIERHRGLKKLEESSYSDWLDWVLEMCVWFWPEQTCIKIFEWLLLNKELGQLPKPSIGDEPVQRLRTREVPVDQGHADQSGRLDILFPFKEFKKVFHIEVKVTSAEHADLGKHSGYVQALKKKHGNCEIFHILLVTQADESCYPIEGGSEVFHTLLWRDLNSRLREFAVNENVPRLVGGVVLFFCAMLEQCLLGINRDSARQLELLRQNSERGVTAMSELYEEGINGYVQAQYALRQFEKLIHDEISEVLTAERIAWIKSLSNGSGGGPYTNDPKEDEGVGSAQWWAWITRNFWIEKFRVTLYVGIRFEAGNTFACVALVPGNARVRDSIKGQLLDKRGFGDWMWNDYEFHIDQELDGSKGVDGLREALGNLLDCNLKPFLEQASQ